jgi:Flp pilus assembly protein TadD/chemotaxis regulatin CheY-phosphate phosphatase CheZ
VRQPEDDLFVGRTAEQRRLRELLDEAAERHPAGPDEGYAVVVHGPGGIGKSALLRRYRLIARGDLGGDRANRRRFLVASVDWEYERGLRPDDFDEFGGPPIWVVLDRLHLALREAMRDTTARRRRHGDAAFDQFRQRMARIAELHERAAALGLDAVIGRRRLGVAEIRRLRGAANAAARAVAADLVNAADPEPAASPGLDSLAQAIERTLTQPHQRRGAAVDTSAYEALVDEVEALVRAFADAVRVISHQVRPVVLIQDACELLGETADWMRDAVRHAGSRTVWVLGIRLDGDPDGDAPAEPGRFREGLSEPRLHLVALPRFDDQTLYRYLSRRLGATPPAGVSREAVARATGGVPLAAFLVARMLATGRDPNVVLADPDAGAEPGEVVPELTRRYLAQARKVPRLYYDLPLLYGLALLRSNHADTQLLAALWDMPVGEVPRRLEELASRHSFVLSATRRMHEDVRAVIQEHLRRPGERGRVAEMNQRAVAHLRRRLTAGEPHTIEDALADPSWRSGVLTLLWHTFWADPADGVDLLRELLPAALVLSPELRRAMMTLARQFAAAGPRSGAQAIADLHMLVSRLAGADLSGYLAPTWQPAPLPPGDAEAGLRALTGAPSGAPVLPADVPRAAFVALLRVSSISRCGGDAATAMSELDRAASLVPTTAAHTGQALASIARTLAGELLEPARGRAPAAGLALRAARLAVRYAPAEPEGYAVLGAASAGLGRAQEAAAAFGDAARLRPDDPSFLNSLGMAHLMRGEQAEAEATIRRAVAMRPAAASLNFGLGLVLERQGRLAEAETAYRTAIGLDRLAAGDYHFRLGALLSRQQRFDEAQAAYREAIHLDPEAAPAYFALGCLLVHLGRPEDAETFLREAVRTGPDNEHHHDQLAYVLAGQGRHAAAETAWRSAIAVRPGEARFHRNLGIMLTRQGRYVDAGTAFAEAVRLDPDTSRYHGDLGELRLLCRDEEGARLELGRALKLERVPGLEPCALLAVLNRVDDPSAAQDLARAALLAPAPAISPFRHAELGAICLALLDRPQDAVARLRKGASRRERSDLFQRPLYELLAMPAPAVPGLADLLAVWQSIVTEDPAAAEPWGGPDHIAMAPR